VATLLYHQKWEKKNENMFTSDMFTIDIENTTVGILNSPAKAGIKIKRYHKWEPLLQQLYPILIILQYSQG
jgi:hypothetical protein